MAINESLLIELDHQSATTRKVLERVPADRLDWKPHAKSMTMGRLATHLAELPGWGEVVLTQSEFDVEPPGGSDYVPVQAESVAQILETFDANVAKVRGIIAGMSDEEFMQLWTMKKAGEEVFTAPRIGVIRDVILHHAAHHRGQLTVYLRLNDVPVPSTFGPTADEPM